MVTSYIGLGSNLGEREVNIRLAIERINQLKETKVTKKSSIIETFPVGGPPQGKFLNAAVEVETGLPPRELLKNLQNIETELGRIRNAKNGPRTIDLDILLYADIKLNEKDLILPHPRLREREFVLAPLREIAPQVLGNLSREDNQKN